jgi:ribonuclease J
VNGDIIRLAPNGPADRRGGSGGCARRRRDPAGGRHDDQRAAQAGAYGQISVAVAIDEGQSDRAAPGQVEGVPVEEDRDDFLDEAPMSPPKR